MPALPIKCRKQEKVQNTQAVEWWPQHAHVQLSQNGRWREDHLELRFLVLKLRGFTELHVQRLKKEIIKTGCELVCREAMELED